MPFPTSQSLRLCLAAVITVFLLPSSLAQQAPIELSQNIVDASNIFVANLNSMQRDKASYGFDDEERLNGHFIPRARKGIPLKELNSTVLTDMAAPIRVKMTGAVHKKKPAAGRLD